MSTIVDTLYFGPDEGAIVGGEFASSTVALDTPDPANELLVHWAINLAGAPVEATEAQFVFEFYYNGDLFGGEGPILIPLTDGSGTGEADLGPYGFPELLSMPGAFEWRAYLDAMRDEANDPVEGSVGTTLSGTLYVIMGDTPPEPPGPVESPAVPESLLTDLRALYAQLVTDTSVANDRAILISSRQESIGENGERTYTTTELETVYGQASYTTQSAATRALGRPTGERVVQITLPYDAPFSADYTYTVDGAVYSPIPGEDNLGTAYRAYTQFLAKRRS